MHEFLLVFLIFYAIIGFFVVAWVIFDEEHEYNTKQKIFVGILGGPLVWFAAVSIVIVGLILRPLVYIFEKLGD